MEISLEEILTRLDTPPETYVQEKMLWEQVAESDDMVSLDVFYDKIGLGQFGGDYEVPLALCSIAKLRLNGFEQGIRESMQEEMQKVPASYRIKHGFRKVSSWMHNVVSRDKIHLKKTESAYHAEVRDKWETWICDGFKFMLAEGAVRFYTLWKDVNSGTKRTTDYLKQHPGDYEGLFAEYCSMV